jgi:hypothetical protein
MTRVVLDASLREKLHQLIQPLELCDEDGKVLARLTPVYSASEYGPLEPQISDEEIQRRIKSDKWHTTAQVLTHLNGMENK